MTAAHVTLGLALMLVTLFGYKCYISIMDLLERIERQQRAIADELDIDDLPQDEAAKLLQ